MLECSATDIHNCLRKATNINAAVKNFLKREVKKGDPSEKCAKTLKDIFGSQDQARSLDFVATSMPKFLNHLYSIACYAYFEPIGKLASSVVEKYADDFNATFEVQNNILAYKNEGEFKRISDEALSILRSGLKDMGFDDSPFMKNVTLLSIFERPVIEVIAERF